ncbi:MAG TPA: YicC family protein [Verrucomicrobiota bacterium]|nr:YicC family protein [Verrucomicrobiota bacterium]HRZ58472.1 YicC family protein [Candidatus Paceibacterota bacterium]
MKSMTGYGRGEASRDGCRVTVEISAVNRRQAEVALRLPPELEPLEVQIREEINRRVARGRVNVRMTLHRSAKQWAASVRFNRPLVKAYTREFERLARELRIDEPVSLHALLRIPGVVESTGADADPEALWPAVEAALGKALAGLGRMREREGAHLAKDLKARAAVMRRLSLEVARQAPGVVDRYREQLLVRIRQAKLDLDANDDRLLKEVVMFADRADISEEITRLQSHFQQFNDCMRSAEPVGRTLDFLAQEMNREVNTIGSKANDSGICQAVVRMKAELERIREQIQNLE